MQLFYTSNPNATILEDDEFFHCTKVLRNRENDNIFLTDGRGNLFESKILKIKKNHCVIKKLKKIKTIKKNNTNHVVCSIIKSQNRLEWMIEKLTEIGIDEITFISTKYSERSNINYKRIDKKIISALKQCKSLFKPKVNELISLNEFLKNEYKKSNKYVADISSKIEMKKNNNNENSLILVGPEGDFSKEELEILNKKGYQGISLGNQVLRSETAALISGYLLVSK
ncbi:MAG: 16S rRNA (uracil(1498)-N(3))-methyltransferase [Flammeovirgaceae bacterium]|nr:16S rRNA (uracil(1498)-N(3))-methyltransferase [Flammeovirgaceae bacterium]